MNQEGVSNIEIKIYVIARKAIARRSNLLAVSGIASPYRARNDGRVRYIILLDDRATTPGYQSY